MRVAMLVVLVALGVSSCNGGAKTRAGDGTLVLELGGGHGSLRRALLLVGVVIEPRPMQAAGGTPMGSMDQILGIAHAPPEPVDPAVGSRVGPRADPRVGPPAEDPVPEPDPAPSYREVELQPNETISHLASRHLGSVRRYHEILELNGWTEQQSRRLKVGTMVKVPIE